jgi:ABC-type nickel/cobalt efflux system permease component RcnA
MTVDPPTSAAPITAVVPTSGGNGPDHGHAHAHDHAHPPGEAPDHGHGHGHAHVHAHVPTPVAMPRPGRSLVRMSLGERLILAGGVSGLIWLGVVWALRPIG